MNLVALLGIANSRVETYPSSRDAQSGLAVITASTLISPKLGLLNCNLPGRGAAGCGAQDPAQSSTMPRKASRFRAVDNEIPREEVPGFELFPRPAISLSWPSPGQERTTSWTNV